MVWYLIGVYIINRTLHDCLEIRNFSSCVEKIFHEWTQRTSEIFFNTRREISYLQATIYIYPFLFEDYQWYFSLISLYDDWLIANKKCLWLVCPKFPSGRTSIIKLLGIMGIGSHSKAAAVNIMINFYYLGFVISLFCWWTSWNKGNSSLHIHLVAAANRCSLK